MRDKIGDLSRQLQTGDKNLTSLNNQGILDGYSGECLALYFRTSLTELISKTSLKLLPDSNKPKVAGQDSHGAEPEPSFVGSPECLSGKQRHEPNLQRCVQSMQLEPRARQGASDGFSHVLGEVVWNLELLAAGRSSWARRRN